jgi:hypothetical protein
LHSDPLRTIKGDRYRNFPLTFLEKTYRVFGMLSSEKPSDAVISCPETAFNPIKMISRGFYG